MGTSIYYTAERSAPLAQSEIDELTAAVECYAVEAQIEDGASRSKTTSFNGTPCGAPELSRN